LSGMLSNEVAVVSWPARPCTKAKHPHPERVSFTFV
jgi:hypothetical protein